jgi:hypothetical protein
VTRLLLPLVVVKGRIHLFLSQRHLLLVRRILRLLCLLLPLQERLMEDLRLLLLLPIVTMMEPGRVLPVKAVMMWPMAMPTFFVLLHQVLVEHLPRRLVLQPVTRNVSPTVIMMKLGIVQTVKAVRMWLETRLVFVLQSMARANLPLRRVLHPVTRSAL